MKKIDLTELGNAIKDVQRIYRELENSYCPDESDESFIMFEFGQGASMITLPISEFGEWYSLNKQQIFWHVGKKQHVAYFRPYASWIKNAAKTK